MLLGAPVDACLVGELIGVVPPKVVRENNECECSFESFPVRPRAVSPRLGTIRDGTLARFISLAAYLLSTKKARVRSESPTRAHWDTDPRQPALSDTQALRRSSYQIWCVCQGVELGQREGKPIKNVSTRGGIWLRRCCAKNSRRAKRPAGTPAKCPRVISCEFVRTPLAGGLRRGPGRRRLD